MLGAGDGRGRGLAGALQSDARMRLFLFLFIALLACAPAAEDAPRANRSTLRVVTWNVHDLFDEVDQLQPPGDADTALTQAEVEAKLARVGRVLARLDADVLVLEEVENLGMLERLAAGPLAGGGYRAFLREGFDPRGIDVGVLSRVPIVDCVSHLDDRVPDGGRLWSRDLVEIHLDIFERPVVLLGNHLVSRLDPSQDGRRLLQAARVREVADHLRATAARAAAASARRWRALGPRRRAPRYRFLDLVRRRRSGADRLCPSAQRGFDARHPRRGHVGP